MSLFAKQDDYTGRWYIYSAPFTPAHLGGKFVGYKTREEAEAAIAKAGAKA